MSIKCSCVRFYRQKHSACGRCGKYEFDWFCCSDHRDTAVKYTSDAAYASHMRTVQHVLKNKTLINAFNDKIRPVFVDAVKAGQDTEEAQFVLDAGLDASNSAIHAYSSTIAVYNDPNATVLNDKRREVVSLKQSVKRKRDEQSDLSFTVESCDMECEPPIKAYNPERKKAKIGSIDTMDCDLPVKHRQHRQPMRVGANVLPRRVGANVLRNAGANVLRNADADVPMNDAVDVTDVDVSDDDEVLNADMNALEASNVRADLRGQNVRADLRGQNVRADVRRQNVRADVRRQNVNAAAGVGRLNVVGNVGGVVADTVERLNAEMGARGMVEIKAEMNDEYDLMVQRAAHVPLPDDDDELLDDAMEIDNTM